MTTKSSSSRHKFGLLFYVLCGLCLRTIDSQFIEVSHDVAHVGDNMTLKCLLDDAALESNEFATYTWLLNDKKITTSNSGKHFEQHDNTLLIKNATKHLSGYYSCVVEFETSGAKLETPQELINFHAVIDDAADLKLHTEPCGFRIPKLCRNKRNKNNEEDIVSLFSKEGSSISLECHLQDVNERSSVKWLKDGSQVLSENDGDAENSHRFKMEMGKHFKLTILQVTSDDAGLYDCAHFSDEDRFKIKSARRYRLFVDEGFRFTTKPTSVKNLEIGSMGKVHCKAVGSLKIHWIKDARDRLPGDVEDVNGTLIFNNVRMEHRGNYTCVATNDASVIQTSVDVRIVPTFSISPPESLEIVEMQIVFLDCQATGSPAPTIKWFHEGSEITTEGRFRIFENGTLQLRETRQDDAGQYECFAGSSAGFKRVESLLIVKAMDSHSSFEDANQEGSFIMSKAVLMTCLVALVYISLVIALMIWCRHRRSKSRSEANDMEKRGEDENDDTASDGDEENKPLNNETKSPRNNKVHQHKDKPKKLATSPSSTLIIDHLMIPHDRLNDLTKLGRGQFGEVLSGRVTDVDLPHSTANLQHVRENGGGGGHQNGKLNDVNEIQAQQFINVLIKSMSRLKDDSHYVEFRRQIDLYRAVDSSNVVRLLALSFEKDHHFMILEHHRDLKEYLMEHRDTTSLHQLIQFSQQVVLGLVAISKSKLTHRDIALRNCVISSNKLTVKLSSIALCKDKHGSEYIRRNNAAVGGEGYRLIAFRHSAPEVLLQTSTYTTPSDVYSCAIAIWEILNVGECVPFEGIDGEEFVQLVASKKLDYEKLFANEKIRNEQVRRVLMKCWSSSPSDRPTPENLIKSLNSIAADENRDN